MNGAILTFNAGSSSLKFAVFPSDNDITTPDIRGQITGIGRAPAFSAKDAKGNLLDSGGMGTLDSALDHEQAIALLLPWLNKRLSAQQLMAVGHRVVHGGQRFAEPVCIDDDILAELDTLAPLAA